MRSVERKGKRKQANVYALSAIIVCETDCLPETMDSKSFSITFSSLKSLRKKNLTVAA